MRLFLSQQAKDRLIQLAHKHKYKAIPTNDFRNMDKFLRVYTSLTFVDARPRYMREEASTLAEYDRVPSWFISETPRMQTNCNLTTVTVSQLLKLAAKFEIVNTRKQALITIPSLVSAVLEVLGTDLLKPVETVPDSRVKRYERTREPV